MGEAWQPELVDSIQRELVDTDSIDNALTTSIGLGFRDTPNCGEVSWMILHFEGGRLRDHDTLTLSSGTLEEEELSVSVAISAYEKDWKAIGVSHEEGLLHAANEQLLRISGDAALFIRHLESVALILQLASKQISYAR